MTDIKKDLLNRAAENAFQHGDTHLASALYDEADGKVAAEPKIEAYGVKGMKSTKWRKTFKNQAAMDKWVEKNDAEVQGTREAD